MTDPPVTIQAAPSDKTRRRMATRDILFLVVMLIALGQSLYVQINKTPADKANATAIGRNAQLGLCAGRYQDAVDAADTDRAQAIGELIVIITQIPPGSNRESAVTSTVDALHAANTASAKAVAAKAKYNNAGRPLPCPIDQENP